MGYNAAYQEGYGSEGGIDIVLHDLRGHRCPLERPERGVEGANVNQYAG